MRGERWKEQTVSNTVDKYIVNVSSVQDFMTCRYRWLSKWVLNRVPVEEGRPLRFGKLLHQLFESYFIEQIPMEEVIQRYADKWSIALSDANNMKDRQDAADALEDLAAYAEPLCLWKDHYPIENPPLEVEQPFLIQSPLHHDIFFRGRPDRMAILWGRLCHVQNRGLAAGVNFAMYAELATRHLHEHVYAYAMSRKYPEIPYGGTVLNLLRKLKYRGVPTKKNPEGKILHGVDEIFWQGVVNISPEQNEKMMEEASLYAWEMRETERRYQEEGRIPLPNESMNDGYFHNVIDPYFRVLNGEIELDNPNYFKDREETYQPGEEVLIT